MQKGPVFGPFCMSANSRSFDDSAKFGPAFFDITLLLPEAWQFFDSLQYRLGGPIDFVPLRLFQRSCESIVELGKPDCHPIRVVQSVIRNLLKDDCAGSTK